MKIARIKLSTGEAAVFALSVFMLTVTVGLIIYYSYKAITHNFVL